MAPTGRKERSLEDVLREESAMRKSKFAATKSPSKRSIPVTKPRKSSRIRNRMVTIPNRPSSPIVVEDDDIVGEVVLSNPLVQQPSPRRRVKTFRGKCPIQSIRRSQSQLEPQPRHSTTSDSSSSQSPSQQQPSQQPAQSQPRPSSSFSSMPPLNVVIVPTTQEPSRHREEAHVDSTPEEIQNAAYRSIRCKQNNNNDNDPQTKRKSRGVVTGAMLDDAVAKNGGRLKLEKGPDGDPIPETWCDHLVHKIGSVVKSYVPMKAASFGDIGEENWNIVLRHITTFFEVNINDKWLEAFIFEKAAAMFRGWKSRCKKHFTVYGADVPLEFKDRPDEWKWLVDHFEAPEFQKLSKTNQTSRTSGNHINHHSGRRSYRRRAREYMKKGNKAAMIATIQKVYEPDANGAVIAEKLKQKMEEMREGESSDIDTLEEPMPMEEQLKIIEEVGGTSKGVRKVAKRLRKPPLPVGGITAKIMAYQELQEELESTKEIQIKEREEAATKMKELDEKWEKKFKELEDQVRLRQGNLGASSARCPSDAASCPQK